MKFAPNSNDMNELLKEKKTRHFILMRIIYKKNKCSEITLPHSCIASGKGEQKFNHRIEKCRFSKFPWEIDFYLSLNYSGTS